MRNAFKRCCSWLGRSADQRGAKRLAITVRPGIQKEVAGAVVHVTSTTHQIIDGDVLVALRISQRIPTVPVNTQTGKIVATTRAAESTASVGSIMLARGQGTATTTLSNATRGPDGTIGFTMRTTAMNGLHDRPGAPKDAIDFKMNILVTRDGKIGLAPGGRTDGYPSIGAYGYTPAGAR